MKNVTTPTSPHSPPSKVEGVRIVVISFQNIAKKYTINDPKKNNNGKKTYVVCDRVTGLSGQSRRQPDEQQTLLNVDCFFVLTSRLVDK